MWEKVKNIEVSRFYTAGILLFIVSIVGILHSFWILWGFLGIVYAVALYEASCLYLKNATWVVLFSGMIIWLGALLIPYSLLYSLWILFATMMIGASFQAYTKKGEAMMVMPLIYPTISFLSFLAAYESLGIASLVLLLVIVSLSDTFAFLGGKLFGKKQFCPTSPKKTVEGVVIGVSIATLVGGFFIYIWWVEVKIMDAFLLAFTTSLAAIFGDLYESYLKRMAGVKDSGSLLPGHGGVLDRVDGYLFAIIILYPILMWLSHS